MSHIHLIEVYQRVHNYVVVAQRIPNRRASGTLKGGSGWHWGLNSEASHVQAGTLPLSHP